MKNQTTEMTATVVDNYLNILDEITINKINELKEENYHDEDMIEFIKVYGSDNFLAYYEDYVKYGEDYSYDAVDAFVDEFGIDGIANFCNAYYGEYDSEEEFAEQYVVDVYNFNQDDCPAIVDWTKTWNVNLQYDFAFNDGYVFRKHY